MTWSDLWQYRQGETEYSVAYKEGAASGIRSFGRDRRKAEQFLSDYALRGLEARMTGKAPLINKDGVVTDYIMQEAVTSEQYREMVKQVLHNGNEGHRGAPGTLRGKPISPRWEDTPILFTEASADTPAVVVMNTEE